MVLLLSLNNKVVTHTTWALSSPVKEEERGRESKSRGGGRGGVSIFSCAVFMRRKAFVAGHEDDCRGWSCYAALMTMTSQSTAVQLKVWLFPHPSGMCCLTARTQFVYKLLTKPVIFSPRCAFECWISVCGPWMCVCAPHYWQSDWSPLSLFA